MPSLTLLGLGPGNPQHLTREAWQALTQADEIYVRTAKHPTVAALPPGVTVHAFDHLYQQADTFAAVYEGIVTEVLTLARRPQGVLYAVPGHPFVAEITGQTLARRAREEGIPLRVIEGLSFLEPTWRALGRDPLPHTALVDALTLAVGHVPPFPPAAPALIAQLYDRTIASEVKLTLMAVYPDEHRVALVHAAGTPDEAVRWMPLFEIDRDPEIGLLTTLYVPALSPDASFEAFQEVVARLRAPDGCPWDRKQTHRTLRRYLLEETYEVLEAIDGAQWDALAEELGDLLLQILLHAQIAAEAGEFTMTQVLQRIHRKMVRRHPHVFGEVEVADADEVVRNWEAIKAQEKGHQPQPSVLANITRGLPALMEAQEIQKKVVKVGFDWPDIQGVWEKLAEELEEVRQAQTPAAREAEIGDVLFVLVNLARWLGVDAELALRSTNDRFRRRFAAIEAAARAKNKPVQALTPDEMDAAWRQAKAEEKAAQADQIEP